MAEIGPHLTMETPGIHDIDGVWIDDVQVYCVECHLEEGWARCYVVQDEDGNVYPQGPHNKDLKPVVAGGDWATAVFHGKITTEKPDGAD